MQGLLAHELRPILEQAERVSLERKERIKMHGRQMWNTDRCGGRRWLAMVAGVALGIAVIGAGGPSVALAQQEDVTVGAADADAFASGLIEQIFAEIFGGGVAADNAGGSTGGDINVGGNMGGSVTMGGSSGGSVNMGGGSGGSVSMGGDNSGG